MKTLHACAAAVLSVALAVPALADTPAPTPTLPPFAALPEGAISTPPVTPAPVHVAPSEKVPGFHLAKPEASASRLRRKKRVPTEYIQLFASEDDAKALGRGVGTRNTNVCFSEDPGARFGKKAPSADDDDTTDERRWANLQPMLTFPLTREAGSRTGVRAVHTERVVASGDGASLETADVWLDPETRGVRLIGKSTIPLRLIGSIPNGPRVWAMRQRSERLEVIVTEDPRMLARGESLMAVSSRGTNDASGCTHLRVPIRVERGGAESVSILGVAELPPLERGDARAAKAAAEVRVRPVRVHVSVSWTSRDPAPVLTLSFGWEARARSQPADNPEEPEAP